MTNEIDVRKIPPTRRHLEIFSAFDALSPDEGFVLVSDHNPKPLLHQFQTERPGQFEWNYVETGPVRFRVEIRRRKASGPRQVTEYLANDHRRLDAIATEVKALIRAESYDKAIEKFGEFTCGLTRHIEIEEQVLFPTFEQLTQMYESGPTVVMRAEHAEIQRLMHNVDHAIKHSDATSAENFLNELDDILTSHNMKEEQILYPLTDKAAGDNSARNELVKKLQAF